MTRKSAGCAVSLMGFQGLKTELKGGRAAQRHGHRSFSYQKCRNPDTSKGQSSVYASRVAVEVIHLLVFLWPSSIYSSSTGLNPVTSPLFLWMGTLDHLCAQCPPTIDTLVQLDDVSRGAEPVHVSLTISPAALEVLDKSFTVGWPA